MAQCSFSSLGIQVPWTPRPPVPVWSCASVEWFVFFFLTLRTSRVSALTLGLLTFLAAIGVTGFPVAQFYSILGIIPGSLPRGGLSLLVSFSVLSLIPHAVPSCGLVSLSVLT